MLDVRYSAKFKKDYKTIIKRGYNPQLLQDVLSILCSEEPLPPKYKDHNLSQATGNATSLLTGCSYTKLSKIYLHYH